jgi:hypothetical protein
MDDPLPQGTHLARAVRRDALQTEQTLKLELESVWLLLEIEIGRRSVQGMAATSNRRYLPSGSSIPSSTRELTLARRSKLARTAKLPLRPAQSAWTRYNVNISHQPFTQSLVSMEVPEAAVAEKVPRG